MASKAKQLRMKLKAKKIEQEEIEWLKKGKYPLVVEVPGLNGHLKSKKSLSDAIREAVGVEV